MFNLFKKSELKSKPCVDCLYCKVSETHKTGEEKAIHIRDYAKCINPKVCDIDPVTDRKLIDSCSIQRKWAGNCGPKGKYWETK